MSEHFQRFEFFFLKSESSCKDKSLVFSSRGYVQNHVMLKGNVFFFSKKLIRTELSAEFAKSLLGKFK